MQPIEPHPSSDALVASQTRRWHPRLQTISASPPPASATVESTLAQAPRRGALPFTDFALLVPSAVLAAEAAWLFRAEMTASAIWVGDFLCDAFGSLVAGLFGVLVICEIVSDCRTRRAMMEDLAESDAASEFADLLR